MRTRIRHEPLARCKLASVVGRGYSVRSGARFARYATIGIGTHPRKRSKRRSTRVVRCKLRSAQLSSAQCAAPRVSDTSSSCRCRCGRSLSLGAVLRAVAMATLLRLDAAASSNVSSLQPTTRSRPSAASRSRSCSSSRGSCTSSSSLRSPLLSSALL